MPRLRLARLSIIAAAVLGGGIPVFSKIALREIPPFSFTFFRFFLASMLLGPFFWRQYKFLSRSQLKSLILISLLAVANVILFAFGIRLTSATVAQLLYTTVPIVTLLISSQMIKESISKQKTLGVIVGFAGAIVLIISGLDSNNLVLGKLQGNLLIVAAIISFSVYTVLAKKIQHKYSPLTLVSIFAFTTVTTQLPLVITEMKHLQQLNSISFVSILSTIYVGLFGTAIYYLLYQYAIKHGSPTIAAITFYLQPAATILWAIILLGESLTAGIIAGGILSLTSAWIVTKNTANQHK